MLKTINGAMFSKMMTMASKLFDINRDRIDAMNVFPVPDGDTGTNMSLTMQSAVKELKQIKTNRISEMTDAVSRGALRGARGNSGVILSQVLSGLCKILRDAEEIDIKTFAKGLKNATEVAYNPFVFVMEILYYLFFQNAIVFLMTTAEKHVVRNG